MSVIEMTCKICVTNLFGSSYFALWDIRGLLHLESGKNYFQTCIVGVLLHQCSVGTTLSKVTFTVTVTELQYLPLRNSQTQECDFVSAVSCIW